MRYLNVTKARTTFLRLVDNLEERTAIMRDGQPVAVLLNFDDYRALITAQALARDPERLANIKAIAERFQGGDVESFEEAATTSEAVPNASRGDILERLGQKMAEMDVPPHTRILLRTPRPGGGVTVRPITRAQASLLATLFKDAKKIGIAEDAKKMDAAIDAAVAVAAAIDVPNAENEAADDTESEASRVRETTGATTTAPTRSK